MSALKGWGSLGGGEAEVVSSVTWRMISQGFGDSH